MDYIIRKYKKEDCAGLNHVVTVAWNETYKGIVPDSLLEELKENESERIEKGLARYDENANDTLVLEIDGEVVGFSHYGKANQEKFPGCGEIRALYIINKYHGYGLGRKLVDESKKELVKLGFNKMIICCLRDNINGNKFYEHIGGECIKDGVYERLNLPDKIYYYDNILSKDDNMNYEVVFESERIKFIKVNEKLVDDYLKMINDPEVQMFIAKKRWTLTREQELEWIRKNLENNNLIFTMIEKDTNEFIGNIEIMKIENNIGELGISITKDKQDNHYGQEAIERIKDYAFNELGLTGLELNVYATNPRAKRCYEKVGFIADGPGKVDDDIHMTIKR